MARIKPWRWVVKDTDQCGWASLLRSTLSVASLRHKERGLYWWASLTMEPAWDTGNLKSGAWSCGTGCQLVMARYSHKGQDTIRYGIRQNIAIRYNTIRSESASPYVRTASKQATAHNTGVPSFCLSTLSLLQVPGYWPTGEATVVGDLCSLKSRFIQQGYCEYWHGTAVWQSDGSNI